MSLLPNPVEINIKWSDDHRLKNGDLVLFKTSLDRITHKLIPGKPLIPIEILTETSFNDYSDVLSILQSIQTPVNKSIFVGNKIVLGNLVISRSSNLLSQPLTVTRIG